MKSGLTLKQLAAEIRRRQDLKEDFIAPASRLSMTPEGDLALDTIGYGVQDIAHEQIAAYAGIPMPYYRKMLSEAPALLASNVNRWLEDKQDRRMVRTLDGTVRALLSDKYRTLENEDVAEAVLPILMQRDLIVMSAEITDTRLYIKAVDRSIEERIPTGAKMGDGSHHIFDCVSPAIIISNSEVGRGSYSIEDGVFTRACTNLAIFGATMKKYHTGARAGISDEVYEVLSNETKRLTDAAIWAQTRDLVANVFERGAFAKRCESLVASTQDKVTDAVETIERVGKQFGLVEGERKGVLDALINGGDLSRYGVHSAITRFSQDVDNYDRATELERAGAQVIALSRREWQNLAAAA